MLPVKHYPIDGKPPALEPQEKQAGDDLVSEATPSSPPPPPPNHASNAALIIGVLAGSALLLGGVLVWVGVRNLTSSEEHGTAFTPMASSIAGSEDPSTRPSAVHERRQPPAELLRPEEVLSEAEAMRGPIFGKGFIQSDAVTTSVLDAQALLTKGRTELDVAFFGEKLSDDTLAGLESMTSFDNLSSPAPLLRMKIALSPFGSDCSLLSVKSYEWTMSPPDGRTPPFSAKRLGTDPAANEISKISCQRKKGEMLELVASAEVQQTNPQRATPLPASRWSVEVRVPLR